MKIIFIRHAEPDYSIDSLTKKGWQEAKCLQPRVCKIPNVKYWYASPLGRARDTAKTALEGTGIIPETLPWIKEFEGRCPDPRTGERRICWDLFPEDWTKYSEMFDKDRWVDCPLYKGTNVKESAIKSIEAFDSFLLQHGYRRDGALYRADSSKDYTIVIFCHLAISLLLIGHMTNIAAPLLWQGFFSAPTGFMEVQTEERINDAVQFRVRALGDYSHLYAAKEPVSDSGFKTERVVL